MKLIFQDSQKKERIIAEPTTKEEAINEINRFLDDHNFKSYYTRVYEENGRLKLDVGAHFEFFYIEGFDFKEWIKDTK